MSWQSRHSVFAASRADSRRVQDRSRKAARYQQCSACEIFDRHHERPQRVRHGGGRRMKRIILSVLFFIALLAVWHLVVLAKIWSVVLLPDPISVWEYLKGAAGDGTLLQASIVTMRRLLAGYMIGIAAGLPLGLLTARFKLCEDILGVLALGLQTLPSVFRVPH